MSRHSEYPKYGGLEKNFQKPPNDSMEDRAREYVDQHVLIAGELRHFDMYDGMPKFLADFARSENAAIAKLCEWRGDDDEYDGELWDTQCGMAFQFEDGGPTHNGFKFCPYCGGKLKQYPSPEQEANDEN